MKFFSADVNKSKFYSISILITEIVSVALLALIFAVPLYSFTDSIGKINNAFLMQTGAGVSATIIGIVGLVLYLMCVLVTFSSVPFYFHNKDKFIRAAKISVYICLGCSLLFFLSGYILFALKSSSASSELSTIAYVPFFVMCAPTLAISIFEGLYRSKNPIAAEVKPPEKVYRRIEPLIFSFLFAATTFISLFIKLITVEFTSQWYSDNFSINGLKLLSGYLKLSSAYQLLAFFVVGIYIISGIMLLLTLAAFFSKSEDYKRIAKTSCMVNLIFVALIALAGLYFSIGQKLNEENLKNILEYYGISEWPEYKYRVRTQAVYLLAADVVFAIIMLIRKASDSGIKPEINIENVTAEGNSATEGSGFSEVGSGAAYPHEAESELIPLDSGIGPGSTDLVVSDFDPCPAFSELDSRIGEFENDLRLRRAEVFSSPTLKSITEFVVEYAKESENHLSYSPEDIATFIAGLGSSKLAILQGMSGTGKTSLPKIFCEALFGNCEVVEVESSWKDKNELIGYYNEFSKCFTPKKFTQCLYKAALNDNIITFIVLDEMNLSRIEYYFSDFLSLMENNPDNRIIKLLNIKLNRTLHGETINYRALVDGHTLPIPKNVWFVGTANRDESTFEISDKVYDRALTMNFNKRAPKVRGITQPLNKKYLSYTAFNRLLEWPLQKENRVFDADSSELVQKVEQLLLPYNISFGNRILKQMNDFVSIYCFCFNSRSVMNAAIEKVLLSKVVSKLEVKIVEDKQSLADSFHELGLEECAAFVKRLNND